MVNIESRLDAKEDLKQIYEYISRDSVYYANKTIEEIIKKIKYLSMFQYMGRKIPEYNNVNLRELIYKSYRIIYRVNSNIDILKVFHCSRDFLNSTNIINN